MSSNIVGEGFDDYVIGQINKRQEILGKASRNSQDLIWENGKTSFVKLVSSANVDYNFFGLGTQFTQANQLAEKYVLFNGTTDEISTRLPGIETLQRGGIDPKGFFDNEGAYGLGGTQWGFNPMPGIISTNIKSEARGSLRTATVNVKANNRDQFELINILYLRLGYLTLLEWGNNCYYKNDGTFISDTTVSLVDLFIEGKTSYNGFLDLIKAKRRETDGNYDALIGKVVNYNWTFNKDGSYDITIIIRSIGDVIESLKANILTKDLGTLSVTQSFANQSGFDAIDVNRNRVSQDSIIVAFAHSHTIGAKFANVQYEMGRSVNFQSKLTGNGQLTYSEPGSSTVDYFLQQYDNTENAYYVRFGTFLEFLKNKTIPNIKNGDKLINFGNTSKDNDQVISYSPGKQISADPRICTFNCSFEVYENNVRTITIDGKPVTLDLSGKYTWISAQNAESAVFYKGKNGYIKLMNVYFNFVFILRLIEDLKDEKGRIPLVDLLNAMWKGYCDATGNFNNITARINDEDNQIIFIDETALPDRDAFLTRKNYAVFNVYGINSNVAGSFIRDLNLKTEITPELATMVTVGSTANGYVKGQDATTLSNLNRGTTSRISSEIISPENTTAEDDLKTAETQYSNAITSFENFIKATWVKDIAIPPLPIWSEDSFANFTSTQVQLLEYIQQRETNLARQSGSYASSPNNGFLPFNLSLTMDGLSGMKIYERYTIDSNFLPKMYSNTVDFIIKGIDHSIQNNIWITNIESIAIPKLAQPSPDKTFTSTSTSTSTSGGVISINSPTTHTDINNVGKLRNLIVAKAKEYTGITEIGETVGFQPNTKDFENKIKSVGWYSGVGSHWCNWFSNLIWKEAYYEYAKTVPAVNGIITNIFNNFKVVSSITPPLTANPFLTFNSMQNIKGSNYTIKFVKGKSIPKPGDMIIYGNNISNGHVAICAEVDAKSRRYGRIDGNLGYANFGKVVYTPIGGWGTNLDGEGAAISILGFIKPPYADEDDKIVTP